MIENLKKKGALKKFHIVEAFENVDRKDFVPDNYKDMAYIDEALPILDGQTISQPYTVAFMLNLLDPQPGERILDIGAGSGWQTALLAYIVKKDGKVYAMEILPKVCEFGKNNVSKYNFIEKGLTAGRQGIVEWHCQDASRGLPEKAPFDKIIAAAALDGKVPQEWFDQLKPKGRLVVPINNSVWVFTKKENGALNAKEYPGFIFVPFINNHE